MKIKYVPIVEMDIYHFHSIPLEHKYPGISAWTVGETKDIPDDASVRINGVSVNLTTDVLSNSFFKIVKEDKKGKVELSNPNFTCSKCAKETLDESILHPKTGIGVPLEIDGKRVCKACFDSTPKTVTTTGFEFSDDKETK
jgi:hypothetical protein